MATVTSSSIILQSITTLGGGTNTYPSSGNGFTTVTVDYGDTVVIPLRSGSTGTGAGTSNYGNTPSGNTGTGGTFVSPSTSFSSTNQTINVTISNIQYDGLISFWCGPSDGGSSVGWRGRVQVIVNKVSSYNLDSTSVNITSSATSYTNGLTNGGAGTIYYVLNVNNYPDGSNINSLFAGSDSRYIARTFTTATSKSFSTVDATPRIITNDLPTSGTSTYYIYGANLQGQESEYFGDSYTVTRANASLTLNIGISNYSGPTRYYSNGNTVAASSTVVIMNLQSSYFHELTGCGADTIYYGSYTSGASQGSTTAYSNLSPIARTWTTASTRTLAGISGSSSGISGPTYSTGDIVYIWAVLNPNSVGGSTITNSTTMTYTGSSYYVERPDTIVTVTPSTTSLGYVSGHPNGTGDTSSPTVNVTNDGYAGTQYRLYTDDIPRWVSTYTPPFGGGSSTTDFTISYDEAPSGGAGTGFTELPSNGNTYTYTTQCRVISGTPDPVNGGGAAWVEVGSNGEPFDIIRNTADTEPDSFDLGSNATNVSTGTDATSNQITIAGLTSGASASFSVTNTSYTKVSKNGGSYNLTSGTVVNGDTLQVQITAASSNSTPRSTTLSIGSPAVTDSWTVTTAASGGGSSGGGGGSITGGTYGLVVYQAGVASPPVVLDQSTRTNNIITSGSQTVAATSTSPPITCEGMTNTNQAQIGAMVKGSFGGFLYTITRGTNSFTITNNSNVQATIGYIAFRWG